MGFVLQRTGGTIFIGKDDDGKIVGVLMQKLLRISNKVRIWEY